MMWIALQVILGHLCLLPNFWPQKIKIFEKKKKTPGYIIILHLHPKNHNHLMYSSLKMMPTALQVILGQFLPFYSIFVPKLKFFPKKCLKRTKNTKNQKHTKNHNHITCCFSDWVRTSFLPILVNFCSFTPFLAQKIKIFKKLEKTPRDIIILHILRCLIKVGVKINLGVGDFS